MKPNKKLEEEIWKVYDTWLNAYLNGDVKIYDLYLHQDYHFIGSTNNEEFLDRKDTKQFFADTGEQFAGKTELRNETKIIEKFGELVFITHSFDAWFLNESEWVYYSRFRFSSVLQENKEGWRFIYQHFSTPDANTGEGETIGYDKVNEENRELRLAIRHRTTELEQKNKELEIENALEKVRARTMAMQHSGEMGDAAAELFAQMQQLVPDVWSSGFVLCEKGRREDEWWFSTDKGFTRGFYLPNEGDDAHQSLYEGWLQGEVFRSVVLQGKKLQEHYDWLMGIEVSRKIFEEMDANNIQRPGYQKLHAAYFSRGYLSIITAKPTEEKDVFIRFAKVFDLVYTRFLDLQKAEAQAREAEIELALERVRARTMAMQHSDELAEASRVLEEEVRKLGIACWGCAFHIYDEENSEGQPWDLEWFTSAAGMLPFYKTPREKLFLKYYNEGKKGTKLYIEAIGPDQIKKHYDYLKSIPIMGDALKEMSNAGIPLPEMQFDHVAFFTHGHLLFITYEPAPEAHDIFIRFAKVFDQTYTRFLDLQKAEAQVREAKIEAALEKVRSRSMGMQKSEELKEVIKIVYQQLIHLNIKIDHAGFVVDYTPKGDWHFWIADEQDIPSKITHPYFESVWATQFNEAKEKGAAIFITHLDFNEKNKFYNELLAYIPGLPEAAKNFYLNCPGLDATTVLFDTASLYMENFSGITYSEEENDILLRFGKVFQQTYTRFLDLKKSEAQAREAQVEAALERVRSKAMAMHNSEDITETVLTAFQELRKLGIDSIRSGVALLTKGSEEAKIYAGTSFDDEQLQEMVISWNRKDHPSLMRQYSAWEHQGDLEEILKGEELKTYYSSEFFKNSLISKRNITQDTVDYGYYFAFPDGLFYSWSVNPYSAIDKQLLQRFKAIIALTFRRYLDLQKAEAQAREAQVQLALERVRARTMAMQSSEELADTAYVLFEQLNLLGVAHERINIGIVNEENKTIDFWITGQGGEKLNMKFSGRIDEPTTLRKAYAAWKSGKKSLQIDLVGEELKLWLRYLKNEINIPFNDEYLHERRVQTVGFFSRGMLIVTSPEPLQEEALYLLEKFAGVFDLTYTRFSDLKIAEAHAVQAEQDLVEIKAARQKAEAALKELKATQKQLIQSEKMASLGELTAGIAHEIQNPLNFVNNFSEVNKELIEELKSERSKLNSEEFDELLADIHHNNEKINHHGNRADAIVKGMLQHSRSSSGIKEPTDINALCDEYLRLSYHGLRAKDKSFNAAMKTDFDNSIDSINIIPQDIGRVLLNLINNAFYAVHEKYKSAQDEAGEAYQPTVSVSTKNLHGKVEIKVSDNGSGIPDAIKDKIFQPFFTTKPTGQGTGLGLSLSYDIVKAHGGQLLVQTTKNDGTAFIIQLPSAQ